MSVTTCTDPEIFAGGGGGGKGSRPDCQKTALTTGFFFSSFSRLILQFYRGCPMVISKKTIIFQGFRRGPTFSKGPNVFQGGPNANFYRNA